MYIVSRRRGEFLFVDDLAKSCVYLLNTYDDGKIVVDASKPDGTPVEIKDVIYLNSFGWNVKIDLMTGLKKTYECYCSVK